MQHALVFFRLSETAGVVSRSDVEGEFKTQATVKARWEGRWYSAKILFVVSKRICESKVDYVTTSGEIIDDDFEISHLREETPSRASSNAFYPRSGPATSFDFVSGELIRKQKKCNKNLSALALEKVVYRNLQADLVVPVQRRCNGDRVEIIKEALFKYYLVSKKCQVEVWRSARDAMNSRMRRTRKQLREAGELDVGSDRSESMFNIYEFDDDIFD
ncbi:hypothetical protein Aduo_001945 [Ancylostoma duodenale]